MSIKGILIEGRDGHEYLLGFPPQPTGPDGAFRLYDDVQEASRVAMAQLGPRGAPSPMRCGRCRPRRPGPLGGATVNSESRISLLALPPSVRL